MKRFSIVSVLLIAALASGLAFASCDNATASPAVTAGTPSTPSTAGTGGTGSEIPSDLRNTAWTRQISDSEIVTISFGRNMMTMSSNRASSQYNQQWDYRGGSCCGYGYCGFYNGSNSLDFRYTCGNNGLNITGSRMRSLNGNWTRK